MDEDAKNYLVLTSFGLLLIAMITAVALGFVFTPWYFLIVLLLPCVWFLWLVWLNYKIIKTKEAESENEAS